MLTSPPSEPSILLSIDEGDVSPQEVQAAKETQ